jgi:uncharacterized membrane protein YoaT (DUF817 family)
VRTLATTGLIFLTVSMAASLVFGLYNHFAVGWGPDHVGEQAPGPWGTAFVLTAYLLFLTEAMGTYMGLYFLYRMMRASKTVRWVSRVTSFRSW